MAIHSRGRLELAKQWRERDQISPERTKVWTEPKLKNASGTEKKVPVVYYLSRNGHLEHPHFMEVSLSSPQGLYLKDVINRLNVLRGKGMSSLYSWSSKRSYKNGFVWQDLCEDDFIYPAHGQEYVLKGSEILALSSSPPPLGSKDSASSSSSSGSLEIPKSSDSELRRKKTPWSSVDLSGEYKVYKSELIADASTQTDDKKQRRRSRAEIPNPETRNPNPSPDAVLDRDEIEISPPPSSSPETLESLVNADGRLVAIGSEDEDRTINNYSSSGRFRASAVLMQLVSCGSISVKDSSRVPPRGGSDSGRKEVNGLIGEASFGPATVGDKEYFSGSLIEMKKKATGGAPAAIPALKRSNSYDADRRLKMGTADEQIETARAKCVPRKAKVVSAARRREETASIRRSQQGSKRINDDPSN